MTACRAKKQRLRADRAGRRPISPACPSTRRCSTSCARCAKRLADEQNVPAYVVFSDATLAEMAARQPATSAALLEVNGVGQTKLERYGDAFLAVIAERASGGSAQGALV